MVLLEHEMPYHPRDLRPANLKHFGSRPSFLWRSAQFVSLVRSIPSTIPIGVPLQYIDAGLIVQIVKAVMKGMAGYVTQITLIST